jgi:hypothetical protein
VATTDGLKLPIPELTDTADGPNAVSNLANAVEDYAFDRLLPTGVTRYPAHDWGAVTTLPTGTGVRIGDTAFYTPFQVMVIWDGANWRQLGIRAVASNDNTPGFYTGQYRELADPAGGTGRLQRWSTNTGSWQTSMPRHWGTLAPSAWPAAGSGVQYGDKVYSTEIGCIFVYNNGSTWYQDSTAVFTNYTAMETKRAAFEAAGGVLHNGFQAWDNSMKRLYAANGGSGATPPWILIGGKAGATQTSISFVPVGGWTIAVSELQNLGNGTAFAHVDVTKTGSAVAVSATGTIPNGAVAGLPSGWETLRNVPLVSFGVGRLTGGYLSSSGGAFNLSAVTPGGNIAVGESLSLAAVYPLANPLAVANY